MKSMDEAFKAVQLGLKEGSLYYVAAERSLHQIQMVLEALHHEHDVLMQANKSLADDLDASLTRSRDLFAMHALQGMLASNSGANGIDNDAWADDAYAQADAMMKRRQAK